MKNLNTKNGLWLNRDFAKKYGPKKAYFLALLIDQFCNDAGEIQFRTAKALSVKFLCELTGFGRSVVQESIDTFEWCRFIIVQRNDAEQNNTNRIVLIEKTIKELLND